MQENYELVQKGFRILLPVEADFIYQKLKKAYKSAWWDEALYTLQDQWDLPQYGEDEDLVNSLDILNCMRLIDRKWGDVFRNCLSGSCRSYAKELMGVRNAVAHAGQQDLDQSFSERALDTMALLCKEIDKKAEEEIREAYKIVREKTMSPIKTIVYEGLAQPESQSARGALQGDSLLKMVGSDIVEKTTLTRKVTFGGKSTVYPVYRVRLDMLYYNDQNDRIATWISQYESENGKGSLEDLNKDIYNRIIENFIVESNADSIKRTQANMDLVGQQVPGVTLADGRIVDGNRRFTCLRRLQRQKDEPLYFETVIMDVDIHEDKKKIKQLELAIQHGEEKKVDYDLIDFAVGTYRDIEQTKLLTIEEYAESTNESVSTIKNRLEIARQICEFLEYIKLPEQYHIAREYQVYNLFQEMMAPLRQLDDENKKKLKAIVYNNVLMHAIPDQRKFIRDIKGLVRSENYSSYFEEQEEINRQIHDVYEKAEIKKKEDIDNFASKNEKIAEDMQISMEKALLRSRSKQLKAKPSENVSKSISLLMDIDPRLFDRLSKEEKEELNAGLEELVRVADGFRERLK